MGCNVFVSPLLSFSLAVSLPLIHSLSTSFSVYVCGCQVLADGHTAIPYIFFSYEIWQEHERILMIWDKSCTLNLGYANLKNYIWRIWIKTKTVYKYPLASNEYPLRMYHFKIVLYKYEFSPNTFTIPHPFLMYIFLSKNAIFSPQPQKRDVTSH